MQTACSGVQKDTGHSRVKQHISKDSANKVKDSIRAISREVFQPFQYTGPGKTTINYRLLSPARKKDNYPLVLVLHGSGAVGTDNTSQLGVLARLWAKAAIRERYPAYIVVPQFPLRSSNYTMSPDKKVLVSSPDACLNTALQLIDSLKNVLPVNKRKIYVIGFSMGASSAINSLELRPDLFAAAVAVSGIPAFGRMDALAGIPIWLVHGNADQENPIDTDVLLYKELHALGDRHIKFWEVEGLDHDVYAELYTSEQMPAWLFRHKK